MWCPDVQSHRDRNMSRKTKKKRANFKNRLRTGFKSTLTIQRLFKCHNHSSNSSNKLHDRTVGNRKGREVLYRYITSYFQNTEDFTFTQNIHFYQKGETYVNLH